jgi:hypothetical protein
MALCAFPLSQPKTTKPLLAADPFHFRPGGFETFPGSEDGFRHFTYSVRCLT